MEELLIKIQIIALIFFGLVLLFYLILEFRKKRKSNTFKNPLILEISETFQKDLEKLIVEETKRNLLVAREKILKEHEGILYGYQVLLGRLKKEFEERGEEVKKQLFLFSQKINEETSRVSKVGQETQDKVSKEAESKITELTQKLEKTHSEVSDLLIKEAKMKAGELAKELTKEISNVYKSTQGVLEKEIEKTKREIEDYKKERIKELDEKIYLILGEIAKKTLGRAIDLSTHEELVMEALEKAKKEGVL